MLIANNLKSSYRSILQQKWTDSNVYKCLDHVIIIEFFKYIMLILLKPKKPCSIQTTNHLSTNLLYLTDQHLYACNCTSKAFSYWLWAAAGKPTWLQCCIAVVAVMQLLCCAAAGLPGQSRGWAAAAGSLLLVDCGHCQVESSALVWERDNSFSKKMPQDTCHQLPIPSAKVWET